MCTAGHVFILIILPRLTLKYMQEHVRSSSEPPPGQQLGMPENQVPHSYPVFGAAHAFP